ncbi:hypothetical protein CsSME_00042902 [Camellia sinensis var. sinensis]
MANFCHLIMHLSRVLNHLIYTMKELSKYKFWDPIVPRDDYDHHPSQLLAVQHSSLSCNNQLSCLSNTMVSTSQVSVTELSSSSPSSLAADNTTTSHFETSISQPFIYFLGVGAT